jgi:cobalamin biosynthesis protein CobD/CbiB
MPNRLRKFIGAIALLVLVMVWSLVAMALAQSILLNINGLVAGLYYFVAGIGWVLPAMPIISWMSKGDREKARAKQSAKA